MPVAVIKLLKGRDRHLRASLIQNVSEAIQRTLNVPPESVRIILEEIPPENYGVGGLPHTLAKGKTDEPERG